MEEVAFISLLSIPGPKGMKPSDSVRGIVSSCVKLASPATGGVEVAELRSRIRVDTLTQG